MATETVTNYNEDSIKTLEDVVHIRKRPGMYIGRLGDGSNAGDGIYVLLKEVIDNCIDEFAMGYGKNVIVKVGEDGEPFLLQGQPAKIFALSLSSYTFIRDKRRVGENQEIKIELQIWGYYGTPRIAVSNGNFNEETGILTIPYDNTYDTITVIASISDAPTQMAYISVVDETEYSKYWGASDMEPAGTPVEGDSWFNLSDNLIYRYTNGSWMLLSESGVSLGEISEIVCFALFLILNPPLGF